MEQLSVAHYWRLSPAELKQLTVREYNELVDFMKEVSARGPQG